MTGAPLNFCLAKKFVKQYFLLNSFMKLGHFIPHFNPAVNYFALDDMFIQNFIFDRLFMADVFYCLEQLRISFNIFAGSQMAYIIYPPTL